MRPYLYIVGRRGKLENGVVAGAVGDLSSARNC
jgi:hypothetical protein